MRLRLDEEAIIQSRRRMEVSTGGAFVIEDVLEFKGSGAMTFVMCEAWLIQLFELETGEYSFIRGGESVRPKTRGFGTFYPPFAVMRACFKDLKGRWRGLAASETLPAEFVAAPFMFETDFADAPRSVAQVREILEASRDRRPIELNPTPSLLSLKAKRLVGANYASRPAISAVAARLGVTHAHLTRQFSRDFGMSPSVYCRQLRVAAATFRLARGEEIINVSQDVGYNDLSRFYKQFGESTRKTPGFCQSPKKRNRGL